MNIWILTIGSSDVQLKTKRNWSILSRNVRSQLDDRGFQPSDDQEKHFRVPSRVMGVVYGQPDAEQYFEDLIFPLIDNFISKLKAQSISIDRVILVLSDQSIFSKAERSSQSHPYWQDTYELQGLLEKYIKSQLTENSPNLQFQDPPLILKAQSTAKGLDDWDEVLVLLRPQIASLNFPKDSTIYVSHQAGTPAISSAVQFCSLAKFGDRVNFLVSSEYKPELTGFVERSSYLRGIQREQAKKLLENYDYIAIKRLMELYLKPSDRILLNAAIQWNYSEFEEFQNLVQKTELPCPSNFPWWQVGYESAYLSIIRLKQGNTVDCIFHGFRAIEGLLKLRMKQFSDVTFSENETKIILPKAIEVPWSNTPVNLVHAYGRGLYYAFLNLENIEDNPNIHNDFKKFGGVVFENRNNMFHNLNGAAGVKAVFQFWGIDPKTDIQTGSRSFEERLLACLNLVSKQNFSSLRKASYMSPVHDEIKKVLENFS